MTDRKLLLYGGGALLALLLLSSRRLAAGSPGPAANPQIAQMVPLPVGAGSVLGATAGTDQTDFSPSWIPDTSTGDPSMADPNNPLAGVGLDATDPQNVATIEQFGAMH